MNKTTTAVIVLIILGLIVWFVAAKDKDAMEDMSGQDQTSLSGSDDSANMDTDFGSTDDTSTTNNPQTGVDVSVGGVTVTTPKTQNFTIVADNYSFSPQTISVNKGDTVRITLKNTNGTHDLKVDGYDVKTKLLQSGGEDTIEFVANKSGSFEYYCTYGNHRAMGMKGAITVK